MHTIFFSFKMCTQKFLNFQKFPINNKKIQTELKKDNIKSFSIPDNTFFEKKLIVSLIYIFLVLFFFHFFFFSKTKLTLGLFSNGLKAV